LPVRSASFAQIDCLKPSVTWSGPNAAGVPSDSESVAGHGAADAALDIGDHDVRPS
jgi:hypothetical protein